MNDYMYLFTVFIAMGAVTAAERLLPFACSSWRKQRWVGVVGNFLPLAIMVLLVLHASTGSALARGGLPVPEAAGVFLTLIVQWFVKKTAPFHLCRNSRLRNSGQQPFCLASSRRYSL